MAADVVVDVVPDAAAAVAEAFANRTLHPDEPPDQLPAPQQGHPAGNDHQVQAQDAAAAVEQAFDNRTRHEDEPPGQLPDDREQGQAQSRVEDLEVDREQDPDDLLTVQQDTEVTITEAVGKAPAATIIATEP